MRYSENPTTFHPCSICPGRKGCRAECSTFIQYSKTGPEKNRRKIFETFRRKVKGWSVAVF